MQEAAQQHASAEWSGWGAVHPLLSIVTMVGAADIDGDGFVNGVDLGAMLGAWGACQ
ncbi:MAG: hypothetical protein ACKOHI_11435 [Phycisphaerales bacterium]